MLSFQEFVHLVDHVFRPDEYSGSLMDFYRLDIKHTLISVSGFAASLFDDERHGNTFIQQAKLSLLLAFVCGINKDTSFNKIAMQVAYHRADIAKGIRP